MKRTRSSKTGKFVPQSEAAANPDTTVTERITKGVGDLISDVRHFVENSQCFCDIADTCYKCIFEKDLEKIK
jgi:hypothetical protein